MVCYDQRLTRAETTMQNQFLGLPWEAWGAISGAGTLVVGSSIAWIAARASYLQFYGLLQIEFETNKSDVESQGFTVECLMHNRSPFSIVVLDVEVTAPEWARVAVRTGPIADDGHFYVQTKIEPHSSKGFQFYLTGREGMPKEFSVKTRWSRNGLAGNLKSTKSRVVYRPRLTSAQSEDPK